MSSDNPKDGLSEACNGIYNVMKDLKVLEEDND
jgi:hypothetical protein